MVKKEKVTLLNELTEEERNQGNKLHVAHYGENNFILDASDENTLLQYAKITGGLILRLTGAISLGESIENLLQPIEIADETLRPLGSYEQKEVSTLSISAVPSDKKNANISYEAVISALLDYFSDDEFKSKNLDIPPVILVQDDFVDDEEITDLIFRLQISPIPIPSITLAASGKYLEYSDDVGDIYKMSMDGKEKKKKKKSKKKNKKNKKDKEE